MRLPFPWVKIGRSYVHPCGASVRRVGVGPLGMIAWRVIPQGGLRPRTILSGWDGDPREALCVVAERYGQHP